jgi:hypothetical protein
MVKMISSLLPPPASEQESRARNAKVMNRMKEILEPDILAHFRETAKQFTSGKLSPQSYFEAFVAMLGKNEEGPSLVLSFF